MNIKTILKDFDEQFVKEPVDWRENHEWTIPYVDSRADKVKTFLLTSLLSVLKEQEKEIPKDERMCPQDETRSPEDSKIDEMSEAINQERQRQRTSLSSRIEEIERLLTKIIE